MWALILGIDMYRLNFPNFVFRRTRRVLPHTTPQLDNFFKSKNDTPVRLSLFPPFEIRELE